MNRPSKGTPGYDLWIAAIEVATYAPLKPGRYVSGAKISWPRVEALRAALDALDIDWRKAKVEDDRARQEAVEPYYSQPDARKESP